MKNLTFMLLLPLMALSGAYGQVYDTESGSIVIEQDSGSAIRITEDKDVSRGFSIALGGYEVAFTGHDDLDKLPPKERHKMKYKKRYRGHLSVIDFGFNALTSPGYNAYPDDNGFLDLRNGKSIYFGLNAFKTSTALDRRGKFGFTTGISLVWRNYSFSDRITLGKENGMIVPVPLTTNNFKKSKLTTFAIDIPIIFEYNFNKKFFISAGGYVGAVVGSHTKYKAPKTKSRGGNSIELFEYGLTFRAGFRHLYAFGNYGLNDLFKSGAAPQTQTYTIGFGFPF